MSIFRKYDIRGVYPSDINEEIAKKIGKAASRKLGLKGKEAAVGMDIRPSSPELQKALVDGLVDQGCNVIDLGVVATPMLYYEVISDSLDAGFMITASHNPRKYNGIKICRAKALDLTYENGIEKIEDSYKNSFETAPSGSIKEKDATQGFVQRVTSKIDFSRDFRIVLDPGNGCASNIVGDIFHGLGCKTHVINSEPDGDFPGRGPDPTENLGRIKDIVLEKNADLGLAFDGDADRAVFIDERGRKVENDIILALFIKNFASGGDPVIHDVTCSKTVEDVSKQVGAEDILFRVGHSYIKREMMKRKAKLGGEYSGHFFFRENDYYDDPFFAAGKLLETMDEGGKLSELVDELPQYHSEPELRVECSNKEEVPEKIKKDFPERRTADIDGTKIYFNRGWALVRSSGTEDKVSIRFEAEDEKSLGEIKEKVMVRVHEHIEK